MNKDVSVNMGELIKNSKSKYVKLKKDVFQDKSLSLKAKGLYAIIMYLCLEYNDVSESEVSKFIPDLSESEIEEVLQELREAGYIKVETNTEVVFEEK